MTSQPDRTNGIPLTTVYQQRESLMTAACAPGGYPDEAMDSLVGTVNILDEIIWSAPAKNYDDIAAKLRLALYYAEDREVWETEAPTFLGSIAVEWMRLNDEEFAKIHTKTPPHVPRLMAAE